MAASVTALEGIVENGHVLLPGGVTLPEGARVYVVVPGTAAPAARVQSPRLAHPEQAADFVLQVKQGTADAEI